MWFTVGNDVTLLFKEWSIDSVGGRYSPQVEVSPANLLLPIASTRFYIKEKYCKSSSCPPPSKKPASQIMMKTLIKAG